MLRFLKSLSRTVHEERCQDPEPRPNNGDGDGDGPTSLTVWRKSLFVGCSGFTVINSDGDLVYRVDNYGGRRQQEVVLMDASGKPILTIFRSKQKLNLVDNWLVFEGDISSKKQKPIYRARKDMDFLRAKVKRLARFYRVPYDETLGYVIEGSYVNRSCKVLDESGNIVAEIRRKESVTKGVSLGLEVFDLIVNQGFDSSLAMSIVLLLDQMFL
uniref:protein LURP-one-related 17-like n=1 Tax=Erigeron canadensis TaxID=72917 RepID=UPI001CB97A02|nr:protein LURP-one-related 17-like [Erigeron canadensis]